VAATERPSAHRTGDARRQGVVGAAPVWAGAAARRHRSRNCKAALGGLARRGELDAVKAVCMQLVRDISRSAPRAPPSDPRVREAVEYIRQRVAQPVSLPEVATAANLSPGQLWQLFVE